MRIDRLEISDFLICQQEDLFCFGTDAVLLYHFAPDDCGKTIDLCSGNGAVALLLLAGGKARHVTTLELQQSGCDLCKQSAKLNTCEENMDIRQGNICQIDKLFPAESFDTVTVNPPYFKRGCGLLPDQPAIALARHEVECTVDDVLFAASYLLKDNGEFCMVHRRHRRAEILKKLSRHGLAACEIMTVHSLPDKEGQLFLLRARKTVEPTACKETTFTVMNNDRTLSDQYRAIYNDHRMSRN